MTTAPQKSKTQRARLFRSRLISYGGAILLAVIVFGPLYWMINTALKPAGEIFSSPPLWFPNNPTLSNFTDTLDPIFLQYVGNSLLVATGTTVVCILLALLASYAVSRPSGSPASQ